MSSHPKIVLDAYVDKTDFDAKVKNIESRLNAVGDENSKRLAQANSVLNEHVNATKKSTMSWTDFRSMYSTVLDVVRVGQAIWDETGQKYVDNAVKVGDMARSLGTTTEEASRLKEVADDVGISVQSLTTSFKLAQKDGFQPSIVGLAKMSDEYLKLAPGVERTQYLLDRFGKSGEEMGKLLDKGSKAIIDNAAALDKNLIVTQKAYEEARKYQISVDALKDSWDGLTYKAAPPLVNALTDIFDAFRDGARINEILTENLGNLETATWDQRMAAKAQAVAEREAADATLLSADAANSATGAFESEAEMTARLADEAKIAAAAIAEVTKENQGLLSLVGTLQGEMDSYNDKWAEAVAKYGEASVEVQKLEATHEKAMAKIAVDLFIAKLSVDGLTDAEYNAALQAQLSAGLIDQATIDMAMAWDKSAQSAANNVYQIDASRIAAQNAAKTYTMTMVTSYINQGVPPSVANQMFGGGRAEGGPVQAGVSYDVGERGRETFTPTQSGNITPAMDYKKMGRAIVQALQQAGG